MNLSRKVCAAVRRIPPGRLATYADIARAVGRPKAWRYAGTVLSRNRDPQTPCHRVVRSDGRVGGFGFSGGTAEKARRLKKEGIIVAGGRIKLERFRVKRLEIRD